MLNELILTAKIREGDIKAFEEIFRRYYSPLNWYASTITGDITSAEEIVEELFYVLWKNRERLTVLQSLKNYLYRAVRNEAIQYCEHREVKERYLCAYPLEVSQSPDPHLQLEYKELQILINRTLQKLPHRRQIIFKMHRLQGLKYAEIAQTLSISVKTVEAEMTKALRTLRKEIDNYTLTR